MCGFVGFFDNSENKKETVVSMSDIIKHRGPDSDGYYVEDAKPDEQSCAFGFRRLSIIDLVGADQPIYNSSNDVIIVFNGEIYNFLDLRPELKKLGYKFKTNGDAEVVLHAYEAWGKDCLNRLRGMFAFTIYDQKYKRIFGARDYFGIKPLYYYNTNKTFIFGSEIKSFMVHPYFKKELNQDALKPYLTFQYCPLEKTFFKDVFRLLPGHYFIFEEGQLDINKFFEPFYTQEYGDLEKSANKINDIMSESIRYHKISDVEVGSFLSSGVDSSYIFEESDVDKSYTVWFDNSGFDEHEAAIDLAKMEGKKHQERQVTPKMFFEALDKVQYFSDEPHANLSAIPLYYLAEMAAKDVKVVLSGEGADELFGGYLDYVISPAEAIYKKIPYPIRHVFAKIADMFPNMRGRNFFVRCGMPLYESYIGQANIMTNEEANNILQSKFRRKEHFGEICKSTLEKVKGMPEVIQRMYLDLHFFQPYDILLKADKMTMAHSMELRVPFLDKKVFDYSRKLKPNLYVDGNITKHAFREAAKKKIPAEWGDRKKAGFMVPFREWIREEKYYNFVKEYLGKDYVSEFFDVKALNQLLQDHFERKANNARKIYTVLSFLIWYEQYFILETYSKK